MQNWTRVSTGRVRGGTAPALPSQRDDSIMWKLPLHRVFGATQLGYRACDICHHSATVCLWSWGQGKVVKASLGFGFLCSVF